MKQKFHLEPPHGLLNDPNGLCEFQKKFHVFFQWNPHEKNHSYKCWGHFVSEDFIHWKFLGKAIEPSEFFDRCGTYSGSACVVDDKICLFYTGNNKIDGVRKSTQCLAESSDGKNFKKIGKIFETPKNFTEHFRDPKIFFDGKNFKMLTKFSRTATSIIAKKSTQVLIFTHHKLFKLPMAEKFCSRGCQDFQKLKKNFWLINQIKFIV